MARLLALSGVALSCLIGTEASAGTVVTMVTGKGDAASSTNTMFLEPDRLRISGPHNDMIYRADLGKIWALDASNHAYHEITPQAMQQMRAGMQQMMQQRLQSMPEEQRKKVEAMMAQQGMAPPGAPAEPPKVTYEKTGGGTMVGGWSCTPYKVTVNGNDRNEMCIARLSDVGLTRDDLKAFASLGSFMQNMMAGPNEQRHGPVGVFNFEEMSKAIGYDGVPVQTTHVSADGTRDVENTIKSIEHKSIPADTFDLPAGYTKQDMMGGMMRGPSE